MRGRYLCIGLLALLIAGCQTAPRNQGSVYDQEARDSLEAVAGSWAGKEVTEKDLRKIGRQMQSDRQAQESVEAISNTLTGDVRIKFCPVDGKRFASHVLECPEHHVQLEVLTD